MSPGCCCTLCTYLYVETEVKWSPPIFSGWLLCVRLWVGCYVTRVSFSTLPVTSYVIQSRSFNYCVPHFSHLYGGGYNPLHLPTSQGCCGDSRGSISVMLQTSGKWCNMNLFYSSSCFIHVRVWGQRTFVLGHQAQSLAEAVPMKHTQSQLGLCHYLSLWLCWRNFGSNFANQQQLRMVPMVLGSVLYRTASLSLPGASECGFAPPPPSTNLLMIVLMDLEKIKHRTVAG